MVSSLLILLSINPEHVDSIFKGVKKYEFRKVRSRRPVKRIVIYATAPVCRVVGEAEVEDVVQGPPDDVWTTTKDLSGISKELFDAYYRGRESAFAYKLGCVSRYATPRRLEEIGVSTAPQSFVYLKAWASD